MFISSKILMAERLNLVSRNHNKRHHGDHWQVEKELELAVPTLFKVGLFELFAPDDLINRSNPGRRFVGELAKGYLSEARGALLQQIVGLVATIRIVRLKMVV